MKRLFGHAEAVAAFRNAQATGRMHHAWLVAGPPGVGKALFASKASAWLLAQGQGELATGALDIADDHSVARLLDAGSHPDFMRLERLSKESGTDLARSITVDQVRGLQRLFATMPSLSPWRAIVIDSIDDLERGGANALLKNLEEPPAKTVFFLVSHAPERLLPTIRSRCRVLRLGRLDGGAMHEALSQALPDADAAEIAELARLGEGAPGQALAWRGLDIASLERDLQALMHANGPAIAQRARLAESLAAKTASRRYEAFLARAPAMIARQACHVQAGEARATALSAWERAQDLAGSAVPLSLDPYAVVFEIAGLVTSLARNRRL